MQSPAHPVVTYFRQHLSLTQEEMDYLQQNLPLRQVEKGTDLLREGAVSDAFFFLVKGCIRMYYLVDGLEKTTFFYQAGDFVSSYESFTKQIPSTHYLQALLPSEIVVFPAPIVADILQQFPRFELLARIAMEEELSIYQKMIASFVTMNAEQRYLELLRTKPHLLQQLPQYHIATYLGVSPETLSRIKSRVKTRKTS